MCSYTTLYSIVNRLFSDIYVSQGSVATHAKWKSCKNWLIFDKIMAMSLWSHFLVHPVYTHDIIQDTHLYPLSSVLEIWARQSRSCPFIRRVTIGTPCSITVRTCVAPTSCEMALCRFLGSSADMLAVFVWRLRRAVVVLNCMRRYRGFKIVYCSLDVDSERLRRPYISTVLKFRDAEHYRRGDKSRRWLDTSLLLPRQPLQHQRLLNHSAASYQFSACVRRQ